MKHSCKEAGMKCYLSSRTQESFREYVSHPAQVMSNSSGDEERASRCEGTTRLSWSMLDIRLILRRPEESFISPNTKMKGSTLSYQTQRVSAAWALRNESFSSRQRISSSAVKRLTAYEIKVLFVYIIYLCVLCLFIMYI